MFSNFFVDLDADRSPAESAKLRKKRHQVARACTWCRTHRIKCDAKYPCRNCRVKGRDCTADGGREEIRTFPSALSEIDRLRARVKELESQIGSLQVDSAAALSQAPYDTSNIKKEEDYLPEGLDPLGQHGGNRDYYNWAFALREVRPGSNQAYGSSSTFYFLEKLTSYLDTASKEAQKITPDASPSEPSTALSSLHNALTSPAVTTNDADAIEADLPRAEEERLLGLYWTFYHPLYPILDKDAFTAGYDKLWNSSAISREPSALVDITLALCMQVDFTRVHCRATSSNLPAEPIMDSTDGRWFFRRCQYFLQDELEEPSVATFQCYALSVFWLSRDQRKNAAHNMLAAGLRIGVILGLHVEPCGDLPLAIRDFRRRLWWTVYTMDAQYAMDFGRPIGVNIGQVTCTLPREESNSTDRDSCGLVFTTFNTHSIRLILATRSIYILFHRICAKVLRESGQTDLNEDLAGMEVCAEWLNKNMSYLRTWLQQLPGDMKTPRHQDGQPYSTDRSRLDVGSRCEAYAQRRLVMEVHFHYSAMTLYRPFVTFARKKSRPGPITERHAISCANHAITVTHIIEQDLAELDCLRYWPNVFFWQISAALALLGYVVAYPRGVVAFTAQQAADKAIANIEHLALTFSAAPVAANALRTLRSQVDLVLDDPQLPASLTHHDRAFGIPNISVITTMIRSSAVPDANIGAPHLVDVTYSLNNVPSDLLSENPSANYMANEEWLDALLDYGDLTSS
ncbi:hypothetical protein EK21DRAFT_77947 [Setomelanomma holmii]|uniref:Zn(2)-C6 fungal-type domain-containing protein n=1 Tax=Setomelanomma holmii TaxID=210430 RepID=A0A9P4LGX7_9PLEO|nr:hypothetical protein EK21DRAFT_77947 [Setomelanomma holmii]